MEDSLISVIIPVYNTETYLASCLDSVLTQSYRNLEVIVIDDGSSDFSLKVAEKYAEQDDRVTVYPQENAGLSVSRNRGLSVATGDLICFVDSDDLLLPDALEVMFEVLKEENADIIQGTVERDSVFKGVDYHKKLSRKIFSVPQAIENTLYQKEILPSAWGKLFKRSLFDGVFFKEGIFYEDLDIFYRLVDKSNKIVWIDFPVYFYRNTEGSILNTWRDRRLDVLSVTQRMEEYISEKYPELLPAAKDRRLSANFNMFALCSIHGDEENATKCWEHIKKHRNQSLFNSNARFKNKAGAIVSYLGRNIFKTIARRVYK